MTATFFRASLSVSGRSPTLLQRVATMAALPVLAAWGGDLAGSVRSGQIADTPLHPLLVTLHRLGHLLAQPFGDAVQAHAGTAAQALLPWLACVWLLWRGRRVASAFAAWLGGVALLDLAAGLLHGTDAAWQFHARGEPQDWIARIAVDASQSANVGAWADTLHGAGAAAMTAAVIALAVELVRSRR